MVQAENNSSPPSSVPTWLIFGMLSLTATFCGLVLPQSLRGLRDPAPSVSTAEPTLEKKGTLDYEPPALPDMPTPGPMFLRLALGTIFVLILCAFTLWAGKRWVRPLGVPVGENKKLRLLESLPLGGRCSVFLLQAGGARILVGVDQAGIKSLTPLPQPFDSALSEMLGEDS